MNSQSFQLPGSESRPIAADLFLPGGAGPAPLIIYAHGFQGFKDWGGGDLIAQAVQDAGFAWLRFNFSHNGTLPENPLAFVELDAFAANTYTKELADLKSVLDWISDPDHPASAALDLKRTGLVGHSKGGAEAIVFAAEDTRIRALCTWAAVSSCRTPWDSWPEARINAWRDAGRDHVLNGRTGQNMPLDVSLLEDYEANSERLNVIAAAGRLRVPWLICHGTEDTSVAVAHAQRLHAANPASALFTVESDHVFGRKHPWTAAELPDATVQVLQKTVSFFETALA